MRGALFCFKSWTGFLVTLISKCTGGHYCESTSACILSIISTSRRFVIHPTAIWRIFTHPKILRSPPNHPFQGFPLFSPSIFGAASLFFGYTHIFFVGASLKTNLSSVITLSSCFPWAIRHPIEGVGGWWWWKPLGAIDDCCGQEKEAIDLKVGP